MVRLEPGTLYETIVSVYDTVGGVHVAPAGVRVVSHGEEEGLQLEARLFDSSRLHALLNASKACVVHFPPASMLDVYLLGFAGESPALAGRIKASLSFEPARTVHAPAVTSIPVRVEATVTSIEEEFVHDAIATAMGTPARRGVFTLRGTSIIDDGSSTMPISRYPGLFLEFLVAASRARPALVVMNDKVNLLAEFKERLSLLEHISPNEPRNALLRELLQAIARDR